jgi:3'-phosphoadenosine 5'-phosphosulfate sulfotransferase (PAPS reductase)/FAD synthetase
MRADESSARSKRPGYTPRTKASNGRRTVSEWLPIHTWTAAQVWGRVKASGVPHHPAYDLGMPRLSCVFCIFAPRAALELAGRHNPELLDEYCAVEAEIGHRFTNDLSLASVREAIRTGAPATQATIDDKWCM